MDEIKETTFLIIGGGIAGVSCAEMVASMCPDEKTILVTESSLIKAVANFVPVGKCLSKFNVEERNYNDMNTENMLVIVDILKELNSKTKEITTNSGLKIKYKFICICTGGSPKIIEPDNDLIISIRDTESVLDFQRRIKNSKRICLLGNGGIASELAYEAKNIEIDWIIKDDHITSTFVDPGAAQFFENQLRTKDTTEVAGATAAGGAAATTTTVKRMRYEEASTSSSNEPMLKKHGGAALGPDWHRKIDISGTVQTVPDSVKIHYNTEIENIETLAEGPHKLKITLKNNDIIHCDFLVSATGVKPNISFTVDEDFIKGSDDGIAVNNMMETNLDCVYAAGDCCFADWTHSEHWFQMRLWTQACQMGSMAGKSMAAKFTNEPVYQDFCFELFGHVTKLFGMQVVLLGRYNGQGLGQEYEILLRMTANKEYIKFVLKNGILRGVILIGDTGLEETCENLILNGTDLTPYGDDILNPDVDIGDYFD